MAHDFEWSARLLRDRLAGEVILPSDPGFDDARKVWNAMFDRRPAALIRPVSAGEVAVAIAFARERGVETAIRSGAHSPAGHSTTDGGIVIDLSAMRGVSVDADAGIARVNGGALLSELDRAAQGRGLVCPVGVVGHTGVAGLTLGGGFGRLQRRWGLTIDSLRAVELVTADGRRVRASDTEEPELFWGMRGAGPNFGVVTALEFDLHPFGGVLNREVRIYDAGVIHEIWPIVRSFAESAAPTVSMTGGFGVANPPDDYPDGLAGRPIFYVGVNHCGDQGDFERDVAAIRAGPAAALTRVTSVDYLELQGASDDATAFGARAYIRGAMANDFAPATIDALVEHSRTSPADASFAFTAQGGAVGAVRDADTAFTGRSALFEMSAEATWRDVSDDERNITWARRAVAIAEADAVTGRYVNEVAESSPEETRQIYGDEKLERLRALKRAWDPDNVFHLNHNVAP